MTTAKPNMKFWVLGWLGLIWNLIAFTQFLSHVDPRAIAQSPEGLQDFIATRPTWATVIFGIAVTAGVVGCVLMLLRRKVSERVFLLAIALTAVTIAQILSMVGPSWIIFERTGIWLFLLVVLWFTAYQARLSGWLR